QRAVPPSSTHTYFGGTARCLFHPTCDAQHTRQFNMAKQLMFEDHARARMLAGVEKLANAVAITMGPTGRNVIIDKSFGNPTVTKDGVITVEEGKTTDTKVEYVDGMQFDKGYVSPYFITNPATMDVTLENAYILLYEKKISNIRDLVPVLEKVSGSGKP